MGKRAVKRTIGAREFIFLSRKQKAQAEGKGCLPGAHKEVDSQRGIKVYETKTLTDKNKALAA
jgi:hypothetical protein